MIYLQMYLSFLKIGFTSFGGLSMIPLIKSEMLDHGWMTAGEVTDIVAIAEMTPGPLGLNCATFAGVHMGGVLGALAANLGVLTPSLTTALIAAIFFERFKKNQFVEYALVGIRPAMIGMVAGVVLALALSNYAGSAGGLNIQGLLIGAAALLLLFRFHLSIPKVIAICAGLGLLSSFAIAWIQGL